MSNSGNKQKIDVTEPLRLCITTSIQAAGIMVELYRSKINAEQIEMSERSKELLTEILSELDKVCDTVSKAAQEKADSAIKSIKLWRDAFSRLNITNKNMEQLQTALQLVKEWRKNLGSEVAECELACEVHEFACDDDIQYVLKAKAALEKLKEFIGLVDRERAEIDRLNAQIEEEKRKLREKTEAFRAEIQSLQAQADEIYKKFENGEISLIEVNRFFNEYDEKVIEVQRRRQAFKDSYQNPYEDLEQNLWEREKVCKGLHDLVHRLGIYRNNLITLPNLISCSEMDVLFDYLQGEKCDDLSEVSYYIHAMERRIEKQGFDIATTLILS